MVSLVGSEFDTQLDVYSDCETQLGYNDDYDGVQSQVDLTNVATGTYHCKVYGYSSAFGNYVLTVDAYMNPTNPTALSALGGIEEFICHLNQHNQRQLKVHHLVVLLMSMSNGSMIIRKSRSMRP